LLHILKILAGLACSVIDSFFLSFNMYPLSTRVSPFILSLVATLAAASIDGKLKLKNKKVV
jgi:hypothetical protein